MGRACARPSLAALCFLVLSSRLSAAGSPEGRPDAKCSSGVCSSGMNLVQIQKGLPVEINNNWLAVNNKWYSRKRAHEALLGRLGRTSGIWVRPVLLNFRTPAPQEWLEGNVKVTTTLSLSSAQARQIAATVDGGFGGFSGSAGLNSSSHNATYVLKGLTFEDILMIKHYFNNATHASLMQDVKDMYDASHKPRIVTRVWVMVSGEDEHARSCTGGHLSLRYGGAQGSVGASISGSGCAQSTWSFDPNTVIAYEASYLKFEDMAPIVPRGRVKDVVVDWYWTR
uniref:Uncharacterized protein n=1 Tax=Alexandrium monilatum TaxID=311494 RepID=A0A7S4QVZ8_9DINO